MCIVVKMMKKISSIVVLQNANLTSRSVLKCSECQRDLTVFQEGIPLLYFYLSEGELVQCLKPSLTYDIF